MTAGIINVLKPPGMTSHDVVSFIRKTYGQKRVGHAGTLDPAAAGVLPVFVGQATRLIEYTTDTDKSYRAELTVGYETDTGDDTGKIIRTAACSLPDDRQIQAVLNSFLGEIEQIPPMFSALKVGGKKMYELARAGLEVERQPRRVTIHHIKLLHLTANGFVFDVTCSKGTYIRSLCADIGGKLACPAVMSFLVRTRVGTFSLDKAYTLEEIAANKNAVLVRPDSALTTMPKVILSVEQAVAMKNGRAVKVTAPHNVLLRLYDERGHFIGIGKKAAVNALVTAEKIFPNW